MSSRWYSASTDSTPNNRAALGGGGVDALLDDVQADPAFGELGAEGDQVQQGAAEPVQPGDLQRVALAQQLHTPNQPHAPPQSQPEPAHPSTAPKMWQRSWAKTRSMLSGPHPSFS
jgi:hypothetical protein